MSKRLRLLLAGVVLSVVVLGAINSASWAVTVKPVISYNQIQATHTQKWQQPDERKVARGSWFVEMVLPIDSNEREFGVRLASLK